MKKIIYSSQLTNTHDFDNTISFDLTHVCNFDCFYCYDRNNRKNPKNKGVYIDKANIELFFESYESLCKNKTINVNLIGGEPTLHPDLFEIVKLVASRGCVKVIRLTSNGSKDFEYYREIQSISNKVIINFSYHENNLYTFNEFLIKCNNLKDTNLEISYMINPNIEASILRSRKAVLKEFNTSYISLTGVSYSDDIFKETYTSSFSKFRLLKVKYDDGSSSLLLPNVYLQENINPFKGLRCKAFEEYWKISPHGKIRVGCEEFINGNFVSEFNLDKEGLSLFLGTLDKKICKMDTCGCFYHSKKYV